MRGRRIDLSDPDTVVTAAFTSMKAKLLKSFVWLSHGVLRTVALRLICGRWPSIGSTELPAYSCGFSLVQAHRACLLHLTIEMIKAVTLP